jgi:hypothetical protein
MGISSTDLPDRHPEPTTGPTRQEVLLEAGEPAETARAALVVGFDRRPESLTALATAAEPGCKLSAQLRVIHAIDLTGYRVDPDR